MVLNMVNIFEEDVLHGCIKFIKNDDFDLFLDCIGGKAKGTAQKCYVQIYCENRGILNMYNGCNTVGCRKCCFEIAREILKRSGVQYG